MRVGMAPALASIVPQGWWPRAMDKTPATRAMFTAAMVMPSFPCLERAHVSSIARLVLTTCRTLSSASTAPRARTRPPPVSCLALRVRGDFSPRAWEPLRAQGVRRGRAPVQGRLGAPRVRPARTQGLSQTPVSPAPPVTIPRGRSARSAVREVFPPRGRPSVPPVRRDRFPPRGRPPAPCVLPDGGRCRRVCPCRRLHMPTKPA